MEFKMGKCATFIMFILAIYHHVFSGEVHLSVAASLTEVTKALIQNYNKLSPEVSFLPNFGASGALAKQIAQGAPAELFISANPEWMDYLVSQKCVSATQSKILVYNSLVFVGKKGLQVSSLSDLSKLDKIAIGSPKSTPAGKYAETALKAAGNYASVKDKLALAEDVRQALIYADRGEVDGAFVYKTDALLAKDVVILLEVPAKLYPEIAYPVGLTMDGAKNNEAVAFYNYLLSSEAKTIFNKFGFVTKD